MGFEYALVHIKYTIPPAVLLTFVYQPLLTRRDVYKILFLITTAVVSTIPWDSYLIRHQIWTYPPDAIVGLTVWQIPAEELFFFIVQTYNTSLIYLLLSKSTFHPMFLSPEHQSTDPSSRLLRVWKVSGQIALATAIITAAWTISNGGMGTYVGLIVIWAGPFLLLLWSLSYQLLVQLPWTNTVLPIALPTGYLWIVDTLALRRGTWVIESGTKLGFHLWPHLEIEEAIFFLVTNCLIVFGLVAFDNALAVLETFSPFSALVPDWPSPVALIKALLLPISKYDGQRISGLREAVARLQGKSRSFFLASGAFEGKIRLYLVVLYSFCRVADDLVDEATSIRDARDWIVRLREYLDLSYGVEGQQTSVQDFVRDDSVRDDSVRDDSARDDSVRDDSVRDDSVRDDSVRDDFVRDNFPARVRSALLLLPTTHLSREPLEELLKGFEMDLRFGEGEADSQTYSMHPIQNQADLDLYGARVAGTVAQLCLEIIFAQLPGRTDETKGRLIRAGERMGIALQYVNIARDIAADARLRRVYIPLTWLTEEGLTLEAVIKNPKGVQIEKLRGRLLNRAFELYQQSKDAIAELPVQVRAPMRVAVESYMEIGRVLREGKSLKAGRATVPKSRRIWVAWTALSGYGSKGWRSNL